MNTMGYGKPGDANGPDRIQSRIDTPAKMKPCPFCGSYLIALHDSNPYYVKCRDCLNRTGRWKKKELAIERWNRRANE